MAVTLSLSLSLARYLQVCLLSSPLAQRPRLLDFVSALDDSVVKSASEKAFKSLPDISNAVKELTVLKGVGPATASAVLAAYAPDIAPFMSDEVRFFFRVNNYFREQHMNNRLFTPFFCFCVSLCFDSNVKAMEVAIGNSKDYSLKRYLLFVTKLQDKAKVKPLCLSFSKTKLLFKLYYSRIIIDSTLW